MSKTTAAAISRKLKSVGFETYQAIGALGFEARKATYKEIIIVSAQNATEIYNELIGFGYDAYLTTDCHEVHVYGKN